MIKGKIQLSLFFFMIAAFMAITGYAQACFIVGDLTGDCRVDIDDVALVASQWLNSSCDAETGLVLHWKLNETTGSAADSSPSGYIGELAPSAGPAFNPAGGMLGGALLFDGVNDYVWTGYQGIEGSNPRTCTAWIKTDKPSGEIITWGNRDLDTARWVVWIDETGVLSVDVGGGYALGTTVLTDDLWHHIAVTSSGPATDDIVLYVDGKIETITDVVSQTINTQKYASLKLGVFQMPGLTGNYFRGLIDDVRVYDRALSLKEIWNLAITGTASYSCSDLNADEIVNLKDITQLSKNWHDSTPQIVINEFLTDNDSRSPLDSTEILDGNLESSDWIELHNNSANHIDIGGWYLTDDSSDKTMWQFPSSTIIQPNDYLVVFASGKTQSQNPGNYPYIDPAGHLHTNFHLSKTGEYLALFDDGGKTIDEYNHIDLGSGEYGYPRQDENISYGRFYGQDRYFSAPTPNADNTKSPFQEVVEKPGVSIKGGCYTEAFDVTLTCGTEDAFIRYTTDSTVPSLTNGMEYTTPIHIDSLTTIIAKAFKPGLYRSETRIETYIFIEPAVADFNTNLPIVVVDTLGASIPSDKINRPYVDCRVVIVDTDQVTGRTFVNGPEHFEGWGQIRRRGESTYNSNHYALEIQDEYRRDKDVSLLGMPAESDWVLSWDVIDYSMMKNEMAFKWFSDMGHYAPRQRYVEVYLNTGGGKISTNDYKGLFILREKIKRSKNRVDIARMDSSHNLEPMISGGYIIKNDKVNEGDTLLADGPDGIVVPDYLEWSPYGIQVTGAGKPMIAHPGPLEITPPQIEWAAGYLNEVSSVLWQNTSSSFYPGPEAKYTDYIDVISWIDHSIVEQLCCDADAFWGSYYTHKDRNGKIHSGPVWDYDRSFHNNDGTYGIPYNIWKSNAAIFGKWHQKMEQDTEYKIAYADRWFQHRECVLNTQLTMAYIDQTIELIRESRSRPKKTYRKSFEEENQLFKDWITNRLNWLDDEIALRFAKKPPIIKPSGTHLNQGDSLEIISPFGTTGDIYYTLNSQDPRMEGGAINPNAVYYDSGQSITEAVTIVPEDAAKSILVPTSNIGSAWTGSSEPYDDSAWTHGTPTTGVTLGGVGYDERPDFLDFITYDLESLMNNIMPTCYIRIPFTVNSDHIAKVTSMKLRIRYDDGFMAWINGTEIASHYAPSSPDWNEGATGQHGDSKAVVFVDFDCSNYINSLNPGDNILAIRGFNRGDGSSDFLISVELVIDVKSSPDPQIILDKSTCVTARIKDGSNWGAKNTETYAVGLVAENLRITEIMYHPADPNTEYIELQNTGTESINLNLVSFTDGVDFTFGDYTLQASQYVLVVENTADFQAKYGSGLPIAGQYKGSLDNGGEEIVLRDAIGTEIHDFDYRDGWYQLTDGLGYSLTIVNPSNPDLTAWDTKSGWRSSLNKGGTPSQAPMAALPANCIVINELLAHSHSVAPDWIELHNTTTDLDIDISGWFLSDDDSDPNMMRKYQVPDSTIIKAGKYKVFVGDVSFNNQTPAGNNTPFGLSEGGETVYLYSGQGGQVTGLYQTQQKFDASESGVTFGRYEKPELSGGYDFVRMTGPTPGEDNTLTTPLIPDVVITEIYYNPPNGSDYEFVELYNRTGSTVNLWTSVSTENSPGIIITENIPWRIKGTGFEFPSGTSIPAHSRIIVAKNPSKYASAYGPYEGKLNNAGEEIELQIPGDKEYGKARYWIPIDKVDYGVIAPWPTTPDGAGDSLHRINVDAYGRDYSNWTAAPPTP